MKVEDKAELLDAIFLYQNGMEVGKLSYAVSLVFDHMVANFENFEEEYQKKCDQKRENAKKRRWKQGSKKKEEKTEQTETTTPLPAPTDEEASQEAKKDAELWEIVEAFVEYKAEHYHQIQHQIKKNGKENYLDKQYSEAEKLVKLVGGIINLKAILKFCLVDDFRKKQILSIRKLRERNKEKVPYYEVIVDQIKDWKPPPSKVAKIPTV